MKLKAVFFGSGTYTFAVIEMLKKHNLQLVVTTEKSGPFINFLKKENFPFITSDMKNEDDIQKIFALKPDIGVLASYGAFIPEKLLIFNSKLLILNIHPSLLPKYKGPSPIQTTILNGDKQTGVTVIKLDNQIDHGPIAQQKEVKLEGSETTKELKDKLFSIGAEMVNKILTRIENGESIEFKEQDHSKELFTKKITREDGFVDSVKPPQPEVLKSMIRAYYPWPGVWTEFPLFGKIRRIKLLPENKVQVEGKNIMTEKEFVNGYQSDGKVLLNKLGMV